MSGYTMLGSDYGKLYARYRARYPKELLGDVKGKTVLDLCGGGSLRASAIAKDLGASLVIGHDASASMLKVGRKNHRADGIYVADIAIPAHFNVMAHEYQGKFDMIVDDGRFTFNTFKVEPSPFMRTIGVRAGRPEVRRCPSAHRGHVDPRPGV